VINFVIFKTKLLKSAQVINSQLDNTSVQIHPIWYN